MDMNQITRKVVRLKILGSNLVFPRRTLRVVYLGDLNEAGKLLGSEYNI